ncbi:MAG: leucyl aminopeptidase family protein [Planctomycetota bacterium]
MTELKFLKSLAPAQRAKHVAVFAPEHLAKAAIKAVFKDDVAKALTRALSDAKAGPSGKVVSTLAASGSLEKASIALLPKEVSRHNVPSRSHAAASCASGLGLGKGDAAVVLYLERPEHYLSLANAVARSVPEVDYTTGKKSKGKQTLSIVAIDKKGAAVEASKEVVTTAEATRWAAGLVDTPTADMDAAKFVAAVKQAVKGVAGVKSQVFVGKQLLEKGLGGIHAVGRTAVVEPRLLILDYKPSKKPTHTVAFVGKGVVYDTGGLNIKTGGNMAGMKCDMGGAAAVTGAFLALAKQKVAHRVLCLVPLAENAIGPNSYRPDDILTLHSTKTVEINNTDAEGRLLLADGVSYAARQLKPDLVIDAATLTGAQLVATGKKHAAVVSNREGLEDLAVRAGRDSGDLTHPLPFAPEFFQAEFKSEIADMKNSVKDRANAQTSCAGQFVYSHMADTDLPWLHVDLAGPAFPGRRATGFGVALLGELVRQLDAKHLKK